MMSFSLVSKFVSTTGFVVLVWSLNLLTVKGDSITLEPSTVQVNVNAWAYFTCTLACASERTHTIYWVIGDATSIYDRLVYKSINAMEEQYFESITGIHLRIEQDNSCTQDDGVLTQTLRINATSVDLDGTPVQCAAIKKNSNDMDHLSYYAVLRVREQNPTTSSDDSQPSPTTDGSQKTMPSPTPVDCNQSSQQLDIITTITETVIATVTVTETPTPTNTPIKRAGTMSDDALTAAATNSASLKIAPVSITLSLTFVLFVLHLLHTHWH